MSDEEKTDKPLEEGDKRVEVEATAKVSDDKGEQTHEVDVKADATVRDLREKQDEKAAAEAEENKVVIQAGSTRVTIEPGVIDVDDPEQHAKASHAADRPTAKAAVASTSRSFGSSGRPD